MKIAFVIATKDRPNDLNTMLFSLQQQSRRPDQIVVVDASRDPVEDVPKKFKDLNITYLYHQPPSATAQRNRGILAVTSDSNLIAFMDDDAVLEPTALEHMLRFWKKAPEDLGGCAFNWMNFEQPWGGWLKHSKPAQWLEMYSREKGQVMSSGWQTLSGTVKDTIYVEWLPSGASVWRKDIFDRFMFDPYFDGYSYLEDLDFSYSVSRLYKLAIVANAGFRHYPSPSGRISLFQFGKIEVRNRLYFVKKHKLSLSRCYLGLVIRLLMTTGLSLKTLDISYFKRALGNCTGFFK